MVMFERPEISPPPILAEYQHEVEDQLEDDLDELPPQVPISQLMQELERNLAISSPSVGHGLTKPLSLAHAVPHAQPASFLSICKHRLPPPHVQSTSILISSEKSMLSTKDLQSSNSSSTNNLNKRATQAALMAARTWHFKTKRTRLNDRKAGLFRKPLAPLYPGASTSDATSFGTGSTEMGLRSPLKIQEDVPFDIQFEDEVVEKPHTEDMGTQVEALANLVRTTMDSLTEDDIEAQAQALIESPSKKKTKKSKKKKNKQSSTLDSSQDLSDEDDTHPSQGQDSRFLHLVNLNFQFVEMLPDRVKHVTFQHDFSEALDAFKRKKYRRALKELTKCFPIVTTSRNHALLYFDRAILHGCLNNLPLAFEDINEAIRLSSKVHTNTGSTSQEQYTFSSKMLVDFFLCRSVLHRMNEDYLQAGKDSQMAKQLLSSMTTTKSTTTSTRNDPNASKEDKIEASEQEKRKKLIGNLKGKTSQEIFEDACETPPKERTKDQLHFLVTFSRQVIPFFAKIEDHLIFLLWQHLIFENWEKNKLVVLSRRKMSCYIVLQGNIRVETEINGLKESIRTVTKENCFCEASISENLWQQTTLLTTTFTKILLLSENIYKYTLKNLMLDESVKRMHFFRKLNLFEKWTQEQIEAIAIVSEHLFFPANALIVKEKTPVEYLYFIYRGMATAFRSLTHHLPQQQKQQQQRAVGQEDTADNTNSDHLSQKVEEDAGIDTDMVVRTSSNYVFKSENKEEEEEEEEKAVEIKLGQLGSEDIFGEASLFEPLNGTFPASIRADTICEVIRVEKHFFAKQRGFVFLRIGPVDVDFLKKLKRFCFRCPSDKLLIQRIQDKCKWEKQKHNTMKKIYKEKAKTNKSTSNGR